MLNWLKTNPFGFTCTVCLCLMVGSCTVKQLRSDWYEVNTVNVQNKNGIHSDPVTPDDTKVCTDKGAELCIECCVRAPGGIKINDTPDCIEKCKLK